MSVQNLPAESSGTREAARNKDKKPATSVGKSVLHLVLALLASLGSFGVFLLLREGIEDKRRGLTAADHDILLFCHRHQMPGLTQAAEFLAFLGSPKMIVGITVAGFLTGLLYRRVRGAAWTIPLAVIGAGLLIQGVKMSFQRQRPDVFVPLLKETGYSFPSGHSLIAIVVYGLLGYFAMGLFHRYVFRRLIGALTVALVLLIGISRVYVGVHYPTDVLAGWSLGLPWLVGCLILHERLVRHYAKAGEPVMNRSSDHQ